MSHRHGGSLQPLQSRRDVLVDVVLPAHKAFIARRWAAAAAAKINAAKAARSYAKGEEANAAKLIQTPLHPVDAANMTMRVNDE